MWNVKCVKRVEHWVHVHMCLGMSTNPFRCNAMYLCGACEFLIFTVRYKVYALHPAIVLYTVHCTQLPFEYFIPFLILNLFVLLFVTTHNLKLRLCCIFPHNQFFFQLSPRFPFFPHLYRISVNEIRWYIKIICMCLFSILSSKCVVVGRYAHKV